MQLYVNLIGEQNQFGFKDGYEEQLLATNPILVPITVSVLFTELTNNIICNST